MTSTTTIIALAVLVYFTNLTLVYGQENNATTNSGNASYLSSKLESPVDNTRPMVNITSPNYPPTLVTNKIIINGTSSDSDSGILNVSAVAHTFPFKGSFSVSLGSQPIPITPKNWSKWSVPFLINETNSYRIVITAIDKAGNPNYAETTINAIVPDNKTDRTVKPQAAKIALLRPTFTEAAYQENGFYTFFFKYGYPTLDKKITTDLDMLTVKTPISVSEFEGNNIRYLSNITSLVPINGTGIRDVSQNHFAEVQKFWVPFMAHVKKVAPNSYLTIMRDEDVHDGHIFYPADNNKTNAFDILMLLQNEYVTQAEYDNLKQFVKNGGTIILVDANVLRAEVRYDRNNDTITFVKGHGWEFDGKVASKSVQEQWFNETKEWIGSNFLSTNTSENITFANNPFNYTHFEERFVDNPNAKIMMDYGIKFPKEYANPEKGNLQSESNRNIPIENITVASYRMAYDKGKVIVVGLSGRLLSENQKFLKFFDDTILPEAMCSKFQSCTFLPMTHYLYGCTNYKYVGYHCDPISNEFNSTSVLANYTKVASATREPTFDPAKFGMGVNTTGVHALESLRANVIKPYDSNQFSVYLSYKPENYDDTIGNPYQSLISYKNGIFKRDPNNAGWEIELVPNNTTSMKTLRFTVFDTDGIARYNDTDIPSQEFSEIAGTFDGKTVRVFVNGILESEAAFPGNYSGRIDDKNFMRIGGDAYCTCYLANGIIDEVRYYNYSLSTAQVKQINSNDDVLGSGLVGYWKLDSDLKDFSGLKNDMFYNTIIASMAFAPDGRMFFSEKNSGDIGIMVNDTILDTPFASISDIHVDFEQGLLGLAVDSKFAKNHFVYAYYNFEGENGDVYARIIRLKDVNNRGTDKTVILDMIPATSSGFHTGGAISFNKVDDKLYATIGDSIDAKSAQNISSLKGKTIRLNRDGSIPKDNPFPNSPVYTIGHRNMFGIAFNDKGKGIVTEPGSALYDEINSQEAGANYGWRTMQRANMPPNPMANDSSVQPLRSYYVAENPTQATYYNADKHPDLKGRFIVGSFRGDLYAFKISENGKKFLDEIRINTSTYPSKEVVATAVSPNGDIYFGAYDIFRLEKIDPSSQKEIMFPLQINASDIKVLEVNYSEPTKEIKIDLTKKKYGFGSISIKVPKSILEDLPEGYGCYSKNISSYSSLRNVEIPFQIGIQKNKDNNIIAIHPPEETIGNLAFIIKTSTDDSSRLNICLIGNNESN